MLMEIGILRTVFTLITNKDTRMEPIELARLAGVVGVFAVVLLELFQWLAFAYAERDRWSW